MFMEQNPVILGYLGRALSLELSAVQQFLATARLLEVRQFTSEAERFRHDAKEEMEHVERIISRMLSLGCAPNASQLRPTRLEGSLVELISQALVLEKEIVNFYQGAVQYCIQANEYEHKLFFEAFYLEEKAHADEAEAWFREVMTKSMAGIQQ